MDLCREEVHREEPEPAVHCSRHCEGWKNEVLASLETILPLTDSFSSEDGHGLEDLPGSSYTVRKKKMRLSSIQKEHLKDGYITTHKTKLTSDQMEEVKRKIHSIHSEILIFVAVMSKSNLDSKCFLTFPSTYAEKYLPEETRLYLQLLGKEWEVSVTDNTARDSLSLADDIEVCDTPTYMLGWNTHLSEAQKKEVDQKIIPDDFLKRFRVEIPREMKLETQNGHSHTIGVAKYPDKLVLREGWGAFVETYDLHTDDCVVFRYKGDSKFDVIVFDRFGLEKASSVIVDNAPPPPRARERHNSGDSFSPADDTEVRDAARYTLGWHCTLTTIQKKEVDEKVQSIHSDNPKFVAVMRNFNVTGPFTLTFSKQYVKTYVGDKERNICLQRLNKRWKVHFGGSPILKRIESGWRKFVQENDVEVGDICIFELLKIYELCTMEVHIIHAKDFGRPSQSGDPRVEERRKDGTETVEHCHSRSQPVQMQLGDSLMAEDSGDDMDALSGCIGVGLKHLTSIQKKAVKEKVQRIDSEIPICVAVMPRTSVTGSFNLTMSKKYVDKYLGDEVRSIWLERHRKKYHVTLGRKPLNNRVVRGWAKFARDNELEKGDICLLELLKHCKVSAMKVHIIRAKNTS
ncbi:hypothetical protein ACQ4PT_031272 [Festuca glaucescens]